MHKKVRQKLSKIAQIRSLRSKYYRIFERLSQRRSVDNMLQNFLPKFSQVRLNACLSLLLLIISWQKFLLIEKLETKERSPLGGNITVQLVPNFTSLYSTGSNVSLADLVHEKYLLFVRSFGTVWPIQGNPFFQKSSRGSF